jgi:hypothetical protein
MEGAVMKRVLTLLALASASMTISCGDTESDGEQPAASRDAGVKDSATTQKDSGTVKTDGAAPVTIKVRGVGSACTVDRDCMPSGAKCVTELDGMTLQGGYCSAICAETAECGENAGCPVGDVTKSLNLPIDISTIVPFPSYCLKKCAPSDTSACRTGFSCTSAGDFIDEEQQSDLVRTFISGNVALKETYCFPVRETDVAPVSDGGTVDAGPSRLDAGVTGGATDSGRQGAGDAR